VEEALKLYNVMLQRNVAPDLVVYSILADGLCKLGRMEEGCMLVGFALVKGLKPDVVMYRSIVDGYVKINNLEGF
jgi:pentatricopeptide repeat protein